MIFASSNQHKMIERAGHAIKQGELVIFPTETVYGIGAAAHNPAAVAKLYAAKNRPQFNPLIVHCASKDAAFSLVKTTKLAQQLADAFWPGPMSIVLTSIKNSPICSLARAGLDSVALRVPANPICQELLHSAGMPVVAPSANPSGRLSPTDVAHLDSALMAKCAEIIDAGKCEAGIESTIIDARNKIPVILRPGPITHSAYLGTKCVYASPVSSPTSPTSIEPMAPVAPGQLASHYAPIASLRMNANRKQEGEIFIGFNTPHADFHLTKTGNLEEAAAHLFDMLHLADKQNPLAIAVAPIPNIGVGEAINERLERAAAPRN
ncbi:MAG: L-threonylcarbamoyladenylate synthase [Alphaproteobacteria bacterium]